MLNEECGMGFWPLAFGFWQPLPKASLRFRIRGMRKPQSPK